MGKSFCDWFTPRLKLTMSTHATVIRRGRPGENGVLTRIAQEAKGHWGYPGEWLEAWKDALTLSADFISKNPVFVAEIEGATVGFYALCSEGHTVTLEHLWVAPGHIGTGLGAKLFHHAAKEASALGASAMNIETDPNAESFYLRMGAKRIGEVSSIVNSSPRLLPILLYDLRASADYTSPVHNQPAR
jgi:GNAT superfamily N-acetyltransferase